MVITHRLQVERRRGKFAGERPTFYRYSMQTINAWKRNPLTDLDEILQGGGGQILPSPCEY